jgi:dienelactone hydrolase
VFFAIYGGLGVFGFTEIFKANPNVQGSGCYNLNRTRFNPTNIPQFGIPCGYPLAPSQIFANLSVPAGNWSYVTFPSRKNTDSDAVDSVMSIKAIMMVTDTEKAPFVIAVHGIRGCKESSNPMIPAAMLWKAGYNVILPDLRNHGESQVSSNYPYATFGLQEHWDVLGALDYLIATYPKLTNTTNRIGIFGISMGGGTAALAFARDSQYMKAAFLDVPALYVYDTLYANIQTMGYSADYIISAVKARAPLVWSWGFPPFKYDPVDYLSKNVGTGRHVYLVSKTEDKIVPVFNSERGAELLRKNGANVTTFYGTDPNSPTYCNHHGDMVFFQPESYQSRLVSFFNDHLVFL